MVATRQMCWIAGFCLSVARSNLVAAAAEPLPSAGSEAATVPPRAYQLPGVVKNLPAFHERLAERMDYALSQLRGGHGDFDSWRRQARAKVMECVLAPGNNQTTGQSAFTMTHPGLANFLDSPDVASSACPKPMMFCCGRRDALFPVASTEEAFAKMRRVWEPQNAGAKLETRLYDAPHEFNATMQDEAFAWLEARLQPVK